MATITFDYGDLHDVANIAKSIAQGGIWGFGGSFESYADGLKNKIHDNLAEWKLPKENPYGHDYVYFSQGYILGKNDSLQTSEKDWVKVSGKIEDYLEYVKITDEDVGKVFADTSDIYEDYKGFSGFVNKIKDGIFNTIGVDWANDNFITRKIAEVAKWGGAYIDKAIVETKDWFMYGAGRYVANIGASILLTGAAIIGTVVSIVGIPFTGGSSAVIAVTCIGAIAGGISTIISGINTYYTVKENGKALKAYKEDPCKARFYGGVTGYTDYVQKNDLGNAEENAQAAKKAQNMDNVKAIADLTSFAAGAATSFGTKTIDITLENGTKQTKKVFDFSKSNIKDNVLKTFGFEVKKQEGFNPAEIPIEKGKTGYAVSGSYEQSVDIDVKVGDMEMVQGYAVNSEKTIAVGNITAENKIVEYGGEAVKYKARQADIFTSSTKSEYSYLVATDGNVVEGYERYISQSQATKTTVDYTKTLMSGDKVDDLKTLSELSSCTDEKKLKYLKWKRKANVVKEFLSDTGEKLQDATTEKSGFDKVIDKAKDNYFVEQVDKYIYSIPTGDDVKPLDYLKGIGGSSMDKVEKGVAAIAVEGWEVVTGLIA